MGSRPHVRARRCPARRPASNGGPSAARAGRVVDRGDGVYRFARRAHLGDWHVIRLHGVSTAEATDACKNRRAGSTGPVGSNPIHSASGRGFGSGRGSRPRVPGGASHAARTVPGIRTSGGRKPVASSVSLARVGPLPTGFPRVLDIVAVFVVVLIEIDTASSVGQSAPIAPRNAPRCRR